MPDTPSHANTITLGDWLKGIGSITVRYDPNGPFTAAGPANAGRWGDSPQEALQELCQYYHRDGEVVLDIPRSEAWERAVGPSPANTPDLQEIHLNMTVMGFNCNRVYWDGVGLLAWVHCTTDARVVQRPDEAPYLFHRRALVEGTDMFKRSVEDLRATILADHTPIAAEDVRPAETGIEEEAELADDPPKSECLKASLESLLAGYNAFNTGSHEENTMRDHLLKVLVESVAYLLGQPCGSEEQ